VIHEEHLLIELSYQKIRRGFEKGRISEI